MPVLNGQRTIAGAINSILSQTYENWELIIVDDGSTDNTYQEVAKFKQSNIHFFRRSNLGISATRNFGNQMAKGTYCIVQDADDYSMPDRLEKVVKKFRSSMADVVIQGSYVNAWNEQYGCMERIYSPPLLGEKNCLENRINGYPAYKRGVWLKKPFFIEAKSFIATGVHLIGEILPIAPQKRLLAQGVVVSVLSLFVTSFTSSATFLPSSVNYSSDYISAYDISGDVLVTDEDGYLDGAEVSSGYNPIGPGLLLQS